MVKLFLATGNAGKVKELEPLVRQFIPDVSQIIARAPINAVESDSTFIGNARIKARALISELAQERSDYPFRVLADDSGLEVNALGGRPGVHSARYAGDHAHAAENVAKLLRELGAASDRACRYVCSLVLLEVDAWGQTREWASEGFCGGEILLAAEGSGGFGYDPVFWVPALNKRMSLATLEEKNSVSHRLQAFVGLWPKN